MTGKSRPPGPLADRMDRAQTSHGPIRARGVHAAQFSKTAASRRRDSPSFTQWVRPGVRPRGTVEYSAIGSACPARRPRSVFARLGSGQAQAPEAPLARLEHLAVELRGGDVKRLRGQGRAVELDPALLDQPPRLARADPE